MMHMLTHDEDILYDHKLYENHNKKHIKRDHTLLKQ